MDGCLKLYAVEAFKFVIYIYNVHLLIIAFYVFVYVLLL